MADEKKEQAKPAEKPAEKKSPTEAPKQVAAQIAPQVASPTGPVPISAVVGSKEEAKRLRAEREEKLEKEAQHPRASDYLDEEHVERLSHAERRAIARQRGYDIAPQARRISARQFMRLQEEDEDIEQAKPAR